MHANIIKSLDAVEYSVLYKDLADAYAEVSLPEQALELYQTFAGEEIVRSSPSFLGPDVFISPIAECGDGPSDRRVSPCDGQL